MRRRACRVLLALLVYRFASHVCIAAEQSEKHASSVQLRFVDRQSLPNFEIDGRPARVHTQGLFVTDRHYYVTGRLQRNPKRPLLVRFDRAKPSVVEHLDLLTACAATAPDDAALDHPGGFDFDGESFWIPLAISRPNSKSLVVKFRPHPERPLKVATVTAAFRLNDHLGAIACDRISGTLYGANWDTRLIYVWKRDGTLIESLSQSALFAKGAEQAVAIQDWKGTASKTILAGAIDKSPRSPTSASRAVLLLLDMTRKREIERIRVKSPPERHVVLTQEGMAVFDDDIFFLPADLGTNAEVYRYRRTKLPVPAKETGK